MITKADILLRAREWQLTPEVVEKDYALGWMLAAVSNHAETSTKWVFKGGTCLKKCVVETYRFSEDLDFTLLPDASYSIDALRSILADLTAWVTANSGIEFPADTIDVRQRVNKAGRTTFEASVGYRGPLAHPGPPKIRFDLTNDERIVRPVDRRVVFHPYPDVPPGDGRVCTYSVGELVAEKLRALVERARPRDLYDVVQLAAIVIVPEEHAALREIARAKFAVKALDLPSASAIVDRVESDLELHSEWESMLKHQLPALPPVADFVNRLGEAIAWIDEPAPRPDASERTAHHRPRAPVSPRTTALRLGAGEEIVRHAGIRVWGGDVPLEAIRFAGASRLLVEFSYHGNRRIVEPYSLRRPRTGNLLLYGYEVRKDGFPTSEIRAYKVHEMSGVRILQETFTPRYDVELFERSGTWRW